MQNVTELTREHLDFCFSQRQMREPGDALDLGARELFRHVGDASIGLALPMTGGSSALRRLAFAGRWYTGDPTELADEVDAMLAAASPPTRAARAVVSPHAGLQYSGAVAAWSYRALSRQRCDAVVLVGPSHRVAFAGCAMLQQGAMETPWQPLPVDEDLAKALADRSSYLRETGAHIHAAEHSLELQLPFLGRVLPGIPVVPILMGEQTRRVAFAVGDAIADAVGDRTVVIIASSDLSHYHDARTAAALDAQVLETLDRCDPSLLMDRLERNPHHACGGGPIVAVLHAATRLGIADGGVLKYADSGDVTGDKSQVVGYVAAAYARPERDAH
jgi:AmmeMemoRadiSam system protein B